MAMTITLPEMDLQQLNNLKYFIEVLYDNMENRAGFRETMDIFSKLVDDEILSKRLEARNDAKETGEISPFTGEIPLKTDNLRQKCQ